MKQTVLDRVSIGVSTLCAIHCALLPIILATVPAFSHLSADNHEFHIALVFLIVPMSIIAGLMGCAKHKDKLVLAGIASGLTLLLVAAFFGHDLMGEVGERVATVIASFILVFSHWRNYRLCRAKKCDHEMSDKCE